VQKASTPLCWSIDLWDKRVCDAADVARVHPEVFSAPNIESRACYVSLKRS
jgi:hypothetical protein